MLEQLFIGTKAEFHLVQQHNLIMRRQNEPEHWIPARLYFSLFASGVFA